LKHDVSTPGEGTTGVCYYAAIWNRALSDDEQISFQIAPYQILRPIAQRVLMGSTEPTT
jgi:hypothetical protein